MNLYIAIPCLFLEILMIYNYWFSLLTPRFDKKKAIAIFFIVHILNVVKCIIMFDQVLLKALTTTVISVALINFLYKDAWYKKLVVYVVYIFCTLIAEIAGAAIARYVYHCNINAFDVYSLPCILWQLTTYLFVFIFNIIALILLKNKRINPENRVTQFIFLYIAVQCFFVFAFIMFVFEYNITSRTLILMVFFLLLSSVGIGFLIYHSVRYATRQTAEANLIKKESEIKDKHFIALKEQYAEYRRLRHDFYNHINIIQSLNDPERLKDYVDAIKNKLDKLESISYCNNPTLDALLAIKKREASQINLKSDFTICDVSNLNITDFDLCTIISNLLDNAITAASQTENGYFNLEISKKAGRLIILMKNSSNSTNPDLTTTKDDALNHGIGIKTVKSIALKYDGDTFFKYENGTFVSIVSINC